jgi:valyl-tRNA synthetase
MNLPEGFEPGLPQAGSLKLSDRWALSVYNDTVAEVTDNLEKYELAPAAQKVYDFIWDVLCDWTIEIAKVRLTGEDETEAGAARRVLVHLLDGALKLLHPFMPFITEEIYRALPGGGETIMLQAWPQKEAALDYAAEQHQFGAVIEMIRAVRAARADMNVHPARHTSLILETQQPEVFKAGEDEMCRLAFADSVEYVERYNGAAAGMLQVVTTLARAFIPMMELVDREKELARLTKEKQAAEKEMAGLRGRLDNEGFVQKAPAQVVQDIRDKLKKAKEKSARIDESIAALG